MAIPEKDLTLHPCFNVKAAGSCGRVHLPVAPKCNIMCNYCNRKYDCVNESRPGVTSAVLTPAQAVRYMEQVVEQEPRITVAGIAGPGDPLANPTETLETMRRLKKKFPNIIFCLSTNGLNLPRYLDELIDINVSHVTVTVNAIDPEIGMKIYKWVRDDKIIYRGYKAAELLLERQLAGIEGLKERGIIVKVNTIIIPGINSGHVPDIARKMSELDVDIMNCIPICPVAGTSFADLAEPEKDEVKKIQALASKYLPQMKHCRRCRSDAVGLLNEDRSSEFSSCLNACSKLVLPVSESRPYVAVATREGMLVNQHLGEARRLQIWGQKEGGYYLVEERRTPKPGCGPKRWKELSEILQDCRAVLASSIGDSPRKILEKNGIIPVECSGFIDAGLAAVYGAEDISVLKGRRRGLAGGCCSGGGGGCG